MLSHHPGVTVTDATHCARGCTIPDRHTTPCTCADDGHAHTTPVHPHPDGELCDDRCRWCDECDGCQPRETESGVLCRPDLGRARRALIEAPDVAAWVAENIEPGQGPDDQRVTGSREAPAPLNVAALDAIDRLVTVLATWAVEHATTVGLPVPDLTGARATTSHTHVGCTCAGEGMACPARHTHLATTDRPRTADRVTGVKDTRAAVDLVTRLAARHLTYLDSIARQDYAPAWHDEITETVHDLYRRYPTRDRATKVPVPCPACDRLMLYLHPPNGDPEYKANGDLIVAHDVTVICHADDCGKVMPSAEYWRVKRSALLYAQELREAAP